MTTIQPRAGTGKRRRSNLCRGVVEPAQLRIFRRPNGLSRSRRSAVQRCRGFEKHAASIVLADIGDPETRKRFCAPADAFGCGRRPSSEPLDRAVPPQGRPRLGWAHLSPAPGPLRAYGVQGRCRAEAQVVGLTAAEAQSATSLGAHPGALVVGHDGMV